MKMEFIKERRNITNEFVIQYLQYIRRTGIGKHSILLYKLSEYSKRAELIDKIKDIASKHTDGVFVVLTEIYRDKIGTAHGMMMYFPKNGGIGRRLYNVSAKNIVPDTAAIMRDRFDRAVSLCEYDFSRHVNEKLLGTDIKPVEIFATDKGKVYDIIRSKTMLSKNPNEDTVELLVETVFGIERLGVATKWALAQNQSTER